MAITKLPVSAIDQLIEFLNSIGISTYKTYDTIALMIAEQADQQPSSSIIVNDASADPTVDSGGANYEYLGTTNGDLTDYRKLSEEESMDMDLSGFGAPTRDDKNITALATSVNGDSTGATLSNTPKGDVLLLVDGYPAIAGGDKTKDYYWSRDGGTTALALTALQLGDIAYWNPTIAGFQLSTDMIINLVYNV